MARWTLPILAVLVAATLAGCANPDKDNKGDASTATALALEELDVDASSPYGAIRGVVVDQAIRPIAGAQVALAAAGRTQITGDDGQFTFTDLTPGAQFLTVNATGFLTIQTTVDVVAGQASSARIQLVADTSPVPYPTTFVKNGYIEAGASIATFAANLFADVLLNDSLCECYMEFEVPQDTQFFVIEGAWQSAVPCDPLADDMYYQIYNNTATIHIESAFLANPIYVVLNKTAIWGDQTAFVSSLTEGGECPRYNQKFDYFVTAWSNGPAPEGWSIVAGTA